MITGFGNNTVSALASDITATQTTFSVVPGAGEKFAGLLTTDISNPSSPHQVYAKLTLTDSQGTVFEICHLTNVSGDSLTVLRGQEGTTAKGWSLNDVIANFATRGSEQSFVQIEQLQAGDFTSATAGGTPNGLTVSLPSTFLNNGTNDWLLKTPLMITPIATNTGNVTIQLTLAGKVIGTFPAYKGNSVQLDAGDILANAPFICVLNSAKTFFTVINPVKIYAKLGGAAYLDVGVTPGTVAAGDDTRITGAMQKASNLSDVADRSLSRSNLGLGALATKDSLTASDVGAISAQGGNYPVYLRMKGIETLPTETAAANLSALYSAPAPIPENTVAAGVTHNWYGVQIISGLIRDGSTGSNGYGVFVNGIRRFLIDTGGNVYSSAGLFESDGASRVYSPNNPPPYVQDVRLGSEIAAPTGAHDAGYVLSAFDSVGGGATGFYRRPVQKLINGSWVTVGAI